MKFLISLILLIQVAHADIIYSTQESRFISETEFLNLSRPNAHYILGEYHYDGLIQKGHSKIIDMLASHHNMQNNITVAWEFLLYKNVNANQASFENYKKNLISEKTLFEELFPKTTNQENNLKYAPVFQVAKKYNGEIISLNATRELKSHIITSGIENLDPTHLPPSFELGGMDYYTRFRQAMGNHVPPSKIKNYFAAQCYTDSMMAYQFSKLAQNDMRFTMVGAFHTDYNDGYVEEIRKYANSWIYTIKVINGLDTTAEELAKILKGSDIYGDYADYIYIAE